jgi:CheY-like chemotaxis protein
MVDDTRSSVTELPCRCARGAWKPDRITRPTTRPDMLKRILLIDDSEPDLVYTRIVLERAKVVEQVIAFDSARDALAWLADPASPGADLILLDINMPGMNGFEFLQAYEQRRGGGALVPAVVMLTSSPDPSDRRRAEAFGCVRGYVTKPLDGAAAAGLLRVGGG